MTLLRSLLLSLCAAAALAGCVSTGASGTDAGAAGGAGPGEIEVTTLPDPGAGDATAAGPGASAPRARPDAEAADGVAAGGVAAAAAKTPPDAAAGPAAADALAPLEEAPAELVKTPGQIACEKGGGRFVKAGQSGSYTCVRPTRDGGKTCDRAGDCKGVCLARSRSCSPFTPVFGCQEILQQDGLRVTECIE